MSTAVPCRSCGASVEVPDSSTVREIFCGRCAIHADTAPAAPPPGPPAARPARVVPGRGHAVRRARSADKSVGFARWILLVLALLAGISAAIPAWTGTEDLLRLRRAVATLGADTALPMEDGASRTVGQLLAEAEREALITNVVQFGFAAVLFGLWFWSRRAPVPAIGTALGLYLLLLAGDAIADPSNLLSGVFLKAFLILGLLAGLVAARQQRGPPAA